MIEEAEDSLPQSAWIKNCEILPPLCQEAAVTHKLFE